MTGGVEPDEIPLGADCPIERAPVLSEEQTAELEERTAAADKRLADARLAKYKIELFFAHTRRLHAPSPGLISIWESATQLHGGGDAKIYWCPAKEKGTSDCEAVIPGSANGYGFLVCPNCKRVWRGEDVLGELVGNFSARTWAMHLVRFFQKVGHNADLVVKHPKGDLHEATRLEQERQRMGEHLDVVRHERVQCVYPLASILRDTASGADLFTRFLAFLHA